ININKLIYGSALSVEFFTFSSLKTPKGMRQHPLRGYDEKFRLVLPATGRTVDFHHTITRALPGALMKNTRSFQGRA
ncbi:hypothetical protein, partial [Sutterella wadsworthensis]|uniref:hypothetical protein n=1 Tax=Sutterella wadsworthensis TaxID=40545 RepID=UPI00242FE9CC